MRVVIRMIETKKSEEFRGEVRERLLQSLIITRVGVLFFLLLLCAAVVYGTESSALDFFPDIVGEKVSVCFVTNSNNRYTTIEANRVLRVCDVFFFFFFSITTGLFTPPSVVSEGPLT